MLALERNVVHPQHGQGIVRPLNGIFCGRVLVEFVDFVKWVDIKTLTFVN